MKTYRVQSGEGPGALDITVQAETPQKAFLEAVRLANPQSLGLLAECYEEGVAEDEQVYVFCEKVLRDAGMWGNDLD